MKIIHPLQLVSLINLILSLALLNVVSEVNSSEDDGSISCLDDNNNRVEWYIVRKFRQSRDSPIENMKGGVSYGYVLPNVNHQGVWSHSTYAINITDSMIGKTMLQMRKLNVMTLAYNDQPPSHYTVSGQAAHAKGFLLIDTNTRAASYGYKAIWISHSVPKLRLADNGYQYPDTGKKYGQHFFCMNLTIESLGKVGRHLQNMRAHVFHTTNSNFRNLPPVIEQLSKNVRDVSDDDLSYRDFKIGPPDINKQFYLVSQGIDKNQDFWVLISLLSEVSIVVQFFPCSSSSGFKKPSTLQTPYLVENVQSLWIRTNTAYPPELYNSGSDHAKWAIANNFGRSTLVCIGDLNRTPAQRNRGGGAICFFNAIVWKVFDESVNWLPPHKMPAPPPNGDIGCDNNEDPDESELHHPLVFPSEDGDFYPIDYDYNNPANESYIIHVNSADVVKFYLYSRDYWNSPIEILVGDRKGAEIKNVPTKFIIHGFLGYGTLDWMLKMKNQYIHENEDINVIIVDWGALTRSLFRYAGARSATRKVGQYVATMIQYLRASLQISLDKFHCVGHSLGAHVCGYTGKSLVSNYDLRLQRITGLDPAGPLFDCDDTSDRLDKTDATHVDVIHTNTNTYGFSLSIGHIDFYPNGGKGQVGCGFTLGICSHSRSYQYFIESLFHATKLVGTKCSSWDDYSKNLCNFGKLTRMGEHVSFDEPGDYYLSTDKSAPFGRGL